jgi:hypothetical protein
MRIRRYRRRARPRPAQHALRARVARPTGGADEPDLRRPSGVAPGASGDRVARQAATDSEREPRSRSRDRTGASPMPVRSVPTPRGTRSLRRDGQSRQPRSGGRSLIALRPPRRGRLRWRHEDRLRRRVVATRTMGFECGADAAVRASRDVLVATCATLIGRTPETCVRISTGILTAPLLG